MIWIAIALCLVVSFIFSGIEAGILSLNRVRLRHRLKLKDRAAITLDRLLARPERLLVNILIVTNLMHICAFAMLAQEFVTWFGKRGYLVALVLYLPVFLVGTELLPKSLFRRFPYRALAVFAGLLQVTDLALSPLLAAGAWLGRRLFRPTPDGERKLFVAREDFKYLTIQSERVGTLTEVERAMIHNVVDFRTVRAADVMVPMAKVQAIAAKATVDELFDLARRTDFDRFPVLSEDGRIIGLVNVVELLLDRGERADVGGYLRRIVTVKADDAASGVIQRLRATGTGMAAVVQGGVEPLGVITSEDVVKRLVLSAAA